MKLIKEENIDNKKFSLFQNDDDGYSFFVNEDFVYSSPSVDVMFMLEMFNMFIAGYNSGYYHGYYEGVYDGEENIESKLKL